MIFSVVYLLARALLGCLMVRARREASKDAELLVLRHENAVLRRVHLAGITANPDGAWTTQAAQDAGHRHDHVFEPHRVLFIGIPFTIYCGEVASWLVATARVPVLASLESDDCAQWSPQALKPVAVWCKLGLRSGLQGVHAECSHLTQAIPHAAVLRS